MQTADHSLNGFDIGRYKVWAKKYPQYPTAEDIMGMTDDTRDELRAIDPELRIAKIGIEHVPPEVVAIFTSIEEELDTGASVEQRLKAAVSWLRQAEMHIFAVPSDSAEMMIIPMSPSSREQRALQSAVG